MKVRPETTPSQTKRIVVFCVGNALLLDEGIGPAVYKELHDHYCVPSNLEVLDMGCMSMDLLGYVRDYDLIITIDAVDGTGEAPGTVFRYTPDDLARSNAHKSSLHDLSLVDLFDAAALLGYKAQGLCLGMQVENMTPAQMTIGLTEPVQNALPFLIETLRAELARFGVNLEKKKGIDGAE